MLQVGGRRPWPFGLARFTVGRAAVCSQGCIYGLCLGFGSDGTAGQCGCPRLWHRVALASPFVQVSVAY